MSVLQKTEKIVYESCSLTMFMRVAALVFLFLIRLRFPHSKSVAEVIRKRYGQNTVKKLRKLEKISRNFSLVLRSMPYFLLLMPY